MKQGRNPTVWVVRAGIVTPQQLQDGSVDHLRVPGLFGFSVQSRAGRSVVELADGGQFPNASISVLTVVQIIAAAEAAGYTVNLVASPGRG